MIYGGSRAGLVDERLAEYRVHDGALSSDRGRMLSGMVMTLKKARDHAAELGLDAGERRILDASLERRRRAAALAVARDALRAGDPAARRLSLAVARDRGQDPRTRLKSVAVAVAPGLARRLNARRERGGFTGASGIRVPGANRAEG